MHLLYFFLCILLYFLWYFCILLIVLGIQLVRSCMLLVFVCMLTVSVLCTLCSRLSLPMLASVLLLWYLDVVPGSCF